MSQHQARKRFGQNFLIDQAIINHIVRAINPQADDVLVEIGPGQGAITAQLLDACPTLQVVELDRDLVPLLQEKFSAYPQLTIHQADALQFDFEQLIQPGQRLRVVGNLPYNISTPLIFHLLGFRNLIADMHFMLQKEVVQRMCAQVGGKHYGRLGIMCQYHCLVEHQFDVGPECFDPAPKVESAIVRLMPHTEKPEVATNERTLDRVVKTAFQQRRKTLRNALRSIVSESDMQAIQIDPQHRPENLSVADYVRIANFVDANPSPDEAV